MGEWWSGHNCRNDTLALDSVALYRRIGIETIPKETTPFHIDLGMATQFTSCVWGWLPLVSRPGLAADVPPLHQEYRASDSRGREQEHEGHAAPIDARHQRRAEE